MATTTTHYGFDIPQSTDLVKDGATAIATLGQDIDTAMNTALGTKKSGLVLLNTTSFSGVASQSINDVFSATYKKYLVTYSIDGSTTAQSLSFRYRVAGADNTTSNYSDGNWGNNSESASIVFNQGIVGAQYSLGAVVSGSQPNSGQIFIFNPFATTRTSANVSYVFSDTNFRGRNAGWIFNATTSFTGFSLYCGSGTITGVISVYGVNE